jgi:hypothetical protein
MRLDDGGYREVWFGSASLEEGDADREGQVRHRRHRWRQVDDEKVLPRCRGK